MLLITHILFAVGVVAEFAVNGLSMPMEHVLIASLFTILTQYVIDYGSHEVVARGGRTYYRRGKFLHSPEGATAVALFLAPLLYTFIGDFMVSFAVLLFATYSHLLLDAFTERGIYVAGKRITKRRLARYNNPLANLLAQGVGIALILHALLPLIYR